MKILVKGFPHFNQIGKLIQSSSKQLVLSTYRPVVVRTIKQFILYEFVWSTKTSRVLGPEGPHYIGIWKLLIDYVCMYIV